MRLPRIGRDVFGNVLKAGIFEDIAVFESLYWNLAIFGGMYVCIGLYGTYNYSGLVRQGSGFVTVIVRA